MATPTETYGYDALCRLTGVNAGDGTAVEAYTYNKTGDRLSKVAPGMLAGSYTYKTGTHQLTGVGTTTRQVDARGNTTANVLASGTYGFGYNQRNRLTVVQNGGATVGSYVLNALGQRVEKVAGGVSTRFDYDEDSQLLGESTGTTTRDYIWMEGLPVGVVDRNGTAATVNFIHADGLGSPRVVTNASGAVLWQWAYSGNPFGEKAPVSASGYVLNLRYPGQYFDAESGLAYNVNRDYEAATGRYIQSDPLGLEGGENTYAYVHDNPLSTVDTLGLAPKDKWFGFNNRSFQWWLHNCYKRRGDPDVASKSEMAEIYAEYLAAGSPPIGRCSNDDPPCGDKSPKFVAPPISPAIPAAEDGAIEEIVIEGLEGIGLLLSE